VNPLRYIDLGRSLAKGRLTLRSRLSYSDEAQIELKQFELSNGC